MTDADRIAALEKRIDQLESREAIAAIIHRYTEAIRANSPAAVLDFMMADTVVELRHADPGEPSQSEFVARYCGHDEIRGSFVEQAGSAARIWPMVHNLRIEIDGDQARSTCVLVTAIWPTGDQNVGEYRDTFRRVEGSWYFASRTHIGFGNTSGVFSREAYQVYQSAKR